MMIFDIPGYTRLDIKHVVCDYNGTIAVDGKLICGVCEIINELSEELEFHVITADTYGFVERELENVNCKLVKISRQNQAQSKLEYVSGIGKNHTVCIGNGNNDRLMLKEACLGIALVQEEGACVETLLSSNVVCKSIIDAFGYFKEPKRLIATLRR
ncbi:MAG: ATPase P [Desulfobacterales bacterium]